MNGKTILNALEAMIFSKIDKTLTVPLFHSLEEERSTLFLIYAS